MPKDIQQIVAELAEIRERVRAQYPTPGEAGVHVPLADLMPLFHARDAAEGKVAALGKVNPRPPGVWNGIIQSAKRGVARGLGWFVRDQVDFNQATVRAVTETLEALNEVNRSLVALAAEQRKIAEQMGGVARLDALDAVQHLLSERAEQNLRYATDSLSAQIRAARADAAEDTATLRAEMQGAHAESQAAFDRVAAEAAQRVREREREDIRLLRTLADVQNAFQQRISFVQQELQSAVERRATDAETRAVQAANEAIVSATARMERQLHDELRLLRQRVGVILAEGATSAESTQARQTLAPETALFDAVRFSERFRGSEEDVTQKLGIYVPLFSGNGPILDLGCGRGEFLHLMAKASTEAIGVEANAELVRIVRGKGLQAEHADLFTYLEACPPESIGGILCAHVIEHMPAEALVRLLDLSRKALRSGGILALETPNPACLAIFATYFYLDPTHVRPVPVDLVRYLLEEAGFHQIEWNGLHPAEGEFSALKPLPDAFRQQFFGDLDYRIVARKP